jgi:hypothetical protein
MMRSRTDNWLPPALLLFTIVTLAIAWLMAGPTLRAAQPDGYVERYIVLAVTNVPTPAESNTYFTYLSLTQASRQGDTNLLTTNSMIAFITNMAALPNDQKHGYVISNFNWWADNPTNMDPTGWPDLTNITDQEIADCQHIEQQLFQVWDIETNDLAGGQAIF